ncbi:unnamed protein product [Spodoptera littoralis]|uniref:Uncharacterized protein n=1 Tax=Spodoptera littoralis TaxID=7109 RepID=A0A9P0IAA9_SPOLI|nr:unnamed protein product [Spodoptera littoralis]CAH1642583.1 unnamed protein product [Spodoptera littoralis]
MEMQAQYTYRRAACTGQSPSSPASGHQSLPLPATHCRHVAPPARAATAARAAAALEYLGGGGPTVRVTESPSECWQRVGAPAAPAGRAGPARRPRQPRRRHRRRRLTALSGQVYLRAGA